VRLDSFPERVAIGQRADVWIELDRKYDVVRVPLSFVRREGQATYCFVNRAGRIARAELTVGLEGQELVEVTGGLAAGDVVLSGADAGAILLENRRWEALP
jgi:multidrug efflux pump subunit AcrA (membrane-fusion protein)